VELERRREDLAKQGLRLAALSYDSVATLKDFSQRRGIHFPLLSDPDSTIIRAFGLLNEEVKADTPQHGVPHPGTLVIDARGVVTRRDFGEGYDQRRSVASLVDLPSREDGRRIEGEGIVATLSASDDQVATGRRLTLRVDIDVPVGSHVYAPDQSPYRGLALVLEPHPLVIPGDTRLPKPRKLKFRPTREVVLVHDRSVRLLQDILLPGAETVREWQAAHPEAALDLIGRLDYQVCSTTTCGPPSSQPVTWSFSVATPDLERSPEELRRK
jgi:hypothetical protein